jgi:hypothetical protein
MFEPWGQPLLAKEKYILRVMGHAAIALLIICGGLGIGVLGYHHFEGLAWIDALVNAAMILGGMGPVNVLHTNAGKIFASCYALFSGIFFLVVAGVLFAPVVHRFLHRFHLEAGEETKPSRGV